MKSIENIDNIENKSVILRLDLNFPLKNSFVTSPAASPIALSNTKPLVFTVAAAKVSS